LNGSAQDRPLSSDARVLDQSAADVFGTEQRTLLIDEHGQLEGRVVGVGARLLRRDVQHGPKLVCDPELEREDPRDSRKM
jgi:hypothetical protein